MMESKVRELLRRKREYLELNDNELSATTIQAIHDYSDELEQALAGEGELPKACHCNDVYWHGLPCPVHGSHNAKPYKEAATQPSAPPAGKQVPSLWRFEKCTKHDDYQMGCALCEEEILSSKLETAYEAGRLAGLEEAAKIADNFGIEHTVAKAIRAAATQRKGGV